MIGALKQMEAGRKAEDVAREVGVSKHTLYAWKAKYGRVADPFRLLNSIPQIEYRVTCPLFSHKSEWRVAGPLMVWISILHSECRVPRPWFFQGREATLSAHFLPVPLC